MISAELQDFETIWSQSMIDQATGNPRAQGGAPDGVNYEDLIAWCSGNSLSVDSNASTVYSDIMNLLIRKYRLSLYHKDKNNSTIDYRAGVTYSDLEILFGKPSPSDEWKNTETFLQYLIHLGHIIIYSNRNARSKGQELKIRNSCQMPGLTAQKMMFKGKTSF